MKLFCFILILISIRPFSSSAQSISFFPVDDTLRIGGGCTPPIIKVSISRTNPLADSVYVIPGLNTNIWTTDPTLQIHYHPLAYFLNVHNGLTLDYQVSIEDLSDKTEYTVPFDSNYTFEVYHFNLKLLVFEDNTLIDSMAQFCISEIGLRIENDKVIINSDFTLRSFPNPFNSHLLIQYYLPFSQQIKISIYNSVGQELDVIENGYQLAGIHSKTWQAHNLSSGVYFIYLLTNRRFKIEKVYLIK